MCRHILTEDEKESLFYSSEYFPYKKETLLKLFLFHFGGMVPRRHLTRDNHKICGGG